jgi:gamma-glutamyltranspeptidase/glutathione hydrolase
MLKFAASKLGDPSLQALFFRSGVPVGVGAVVKNPALAATLDRIAAEGPAALYEGPIAAEIVDAAQSAGGALSLADLRAYKPLAREPLHVVFEGSDVYTMPPPSAGGMMLVQTLKLFGAGRLRKLGIESGAYQHLIAEALRAAIADRMRYLGDPAHANVDVAALVSDARMDARRRSIALDRTHAVPRFGLEGQGTHHLVTADARGMVVSLTTTVNRVFGARVVAAKSGIVLNDELDDFTASADVAPFGMSQSPNRPRPGARPVSSMTPTIVLAGGRAVLALGGSGGPTIATNVTQLVLSNLVFGTPPEQAVSARRFYVPSSGAYMLLEKGAHPALVENLERRGEIVGTMPFNGSAVQMIARDGNAWRAASDPRKHGTAMAE